MTIKKASAPSKTSAQTHTETETETETKAKVKAKAEPKSTSTHAPATSPNSSVRHAFPDDAVGAEDESAADATDSKDKPASSKQTSHPRKSK